jgi:hypothetical protein
MLTIQIEIKWEQLSIHIVGDHINSTYHLIIYIGYFERYRKTKIIQIQTGGDEFFLPDNEVK